jgi:hypothetical protein
VKGFEFDFGIFHENQVLLDLLELMLVELQDPQFQGIFRLNPMSWLLTTFAAPVENVGAQVYCVSPFDRISPENFPIR